MEATVKTQVVFPKTLLEELDMVVPSKGRSRFIVEATEERLKRERLRRALARAAGSWKEEDYPHLKTREDVVRYVRHMRENFFVRDRAARAGRTSKPRRGGPR